MKISVIIPVYNEERVIKDCIESLKKQSHKDLEVIVVDDGSTDESLAILAESNLRVLKQRHNGAGAARNLGAKAAKGEILVFVDADMTFDRDFIKNLTKPIEDEEVVGTFSKEEYLENKSNIWARCWNFNRGLPENKMHPDSYSDRQKVFRAVTKKEFDRVGGFDEKTGYTDDWSLSEKLGVEALAAKDAIFYHKNPGTLSETFTQSRWMAKRKYKLGLMGYLLSLLRVSLPFSILIGLIKSIKYSLPEFLIFKIVSDAGQFIGILEFMIFGKVTK